MHIISSQRIFLHYVVFNISYFLDHSKITKIEAKTSTVKDAQTNDKITMTISKQETPTYINIAVQPTYLTIQM